MRQTWQSILFSLALAGSSADAQITKPGSLTAAGTMVGRMGITASRGEFARGATSARATSTPQGSIDNRRGCTPVRDARPPGNCVHERSDRPVVVVNVVTIYTPTYDATAAIYAYEEAQNFYQPGYEWGAGLKANNLPWADFHPYLQEYVVSASPVARDAFRRGFIVGFGGNGEATYDHAMRRVAQRD